MAGISHSGFTGLGHRGRIVLHGSSGSGSIYGHWLFIACTMLVLAATSVRFLADWIRFPDFRRTEPSRGVALVWFSLSLGFQPFLLFVDFGVGYHLGLLSYCVVRHVPVSPFLFLALGATLIRSRAAGLFQKPDTPAALDDQFCHRYQISDREREVADLLLAGRSYVEMALLTLLRRPPDGSSGSSSSPTVRKEG